MKGLRILLVDTYKNIMLLVHANTGSVGMSSVAEMKWLRLTVAVKPRASNLTLSKTRLSKVGQA